MGQTIQDIGTITLGNGAVADLSNASPPPAPFYETGAFRGWLVLGGILAIFSGALTKLLAYEELGKLLSFIGIISFMGGIALTVMSVFS